MISSFFPGRIRLRAAVFREQEIVSKAMEIVKSSSAVRNIQHNPLTGSILIEYDHDLLPMDKLVPLQPFFEQLGKMASRYDGRQKQAILDKLDELDSIVRQW